MWSPFFKLLLAICAVVQSQAGRVKGMEGALATCPGLPGQPGQLAVLTQLATCKKRKQTYATVLFFF